MSSEQYSSPSYLSLSQELNNDDFTKLEIAISKIDVKKELDENLTQLKSNFEIWLKIYKEQLNTKKVEIKSLSDSYIKEQEVRSNNIKIQEYQISISHLDFNIQAQNDLLDMYKNLKEGENITLDKIQNANVRIKVIENKLSAFQKEYDETQEKLKQACSGKTVTEEMISEQYENLGTIRHQLYNLRIECESIETVITKLTILEENVNHKISQKQLM